MKKIFLVTVLIEISDESPIDGHRAFTDYSKAKQAMSEEIENAQKYFEGWDGEVLVDVENCQEWRNEDVYGYTIGIEELNIQD